jgi:hypothetical protein
MQCSVMTTPGGLGAEGVGGGWNGALGRCTAYKILNHQAGTISGVAAVYQRHDFLAERRAAVDAGNVKAGCSDR